MTTLRTGRGVRHGAILATASEIETDNNSKKYTPNCKLSSFSAAVPRASNRLPTELKLLKLIQSRAIYTTSTVLRIRLQSHQVNPTTLTRFLGFGQGCGWEYD